MLCSGFDIFEPQNLHLANLAIFLGIFVLMCMSFLTDQKWSQMDAFRTRKTFHELYLHRVVLENDSQCWSVTGADQWNVGIILMSIAKNSNTLPAEKRMEVMNSTPQFSTSWKPLKAQSFVVGSKVEMILPTSLRLFGLFSLWAFASGKLPISLSCALLDDF